MPLIYSDAHLLEMMNQWRANGVAGAVILIDEETTDPDVSADRAGCHHHQSTLLLQAALQGLPIYLVQYGMDGISGTNAPFPGGLGGELDAAIPGTAKAYQKGAMETNGFDNVALVADVAAAGVTDLIIMGQSVNSCCASTARGAAAAGLAVHTCPSVIRGGGVATVAPLFFSAAFGPWPDNSTIYAAL